MTFKHLAMFAAGALLLSLPACRDTDQPRKDTLARQIDTLPDSASPDTAAGRLESVPVQVDTQTVIINYRPDEPVELRRLDTGFIYDIRYATTDNFTGEQLYDCPKCYLQYRVAKALIEVRNYLKAKGYSLKLFDCYRPYAVQKRMWQVVPDANYVRNPHQAYSQHNIGAAVDLTLVIDSTGREADMGTDFDYFGPEAHYACPDMPQAVRRHRWILKEAMQRFGFTGIRTEWWHFSYPDAATTTLPASGFDCSATD